LAAVKVQPTGTALPTPKVPAAAKVSPPANVLPAATPQTGGPSGNGRSGSNGDSTRPSAVPKPEPDHSTGSGIVGDSGISAVAADDASQWLSPHNNLRNRHGAVPLAWDAELAAEAQRVAQACSWDHTGSGENYAWGQGELGTISRFVDGWAEEAGECCGDDSMFDVVSADGRKGPCPG
jgi:uncharacterized protein YkwD